MSSKTAMCMAGMIGHAAQHAAISELILKNLSIAYVDLSRTILAHTVLTQGADAIMWVDHDMVFPTDAFAQLLAHEVPIVGALYRARQEPDYPRMEPFLTVGDRHSPLRRVSYLPGGMLLVRKEVYQKLGMPFYRDGWGLDPSRPEAHIGEDIDFATRCRAAGFEMLADMELTRKVGHSTEVTLWWGEDETPPVPKGVTGARA
jgi:GT2 family glycosyltransferase